MSESKKPECCNDQQAKILTAEDVAACCPRVAIGQHELPPLPYPYEALEPYIGRETVRIHHDLHHKAYVTGLNQAEQELAKQRQEGNFANNRYWAEQVAFNGSGHILHSIYWSNMAPPSVRKPEP